MLTHGCLLEGVLVFKSFSFYTDQCIYIHEYSLLTGELDPFTMKIHLIQTLHNSGFLGSNTIFVFHDLIFSNVRFHVTFNSYGSDTMCHMSDVIPSFVKRWVG